MSKPSKNGRKTDDGKFAPGNRYGQGRPQGSRNKATVAVQELLDGEAEALTRKAIELAKNGDMAALRLCLERLCPPRRERLISVELPNVKDAPDTAKAIGAALAAAATGKITPGEAQALTSMIDCQRKSIEAAEIERRLSALEKQMKVTR